MYSEVHSRLPSGSIVFKLPRGTAMGGTEGRDDYRRGALDKKLRGLPSEFGESRNADQQMVIKESKPRNAPVTFSLNNRAWVDVMRDLKRQ